VHGVWAVVCCCQQCFTLATLCTLKERVPEGALQNSYCPSCCLLISKPLSLPGSKMRGAIAAQEKLLLPDRGAHQAWPSGRG
jgi:hypothetical protein